MVWNNLASRLLKKENMVEPDLNIQQSSPLLGHLERCDGRDLRYWTSYCSKMRDETRGELQLRMAKGSPHTMEWYMIRGL